MCYAAAVTTRTRLLGWPGALGLIAFGLLPELLPVVFGAGEKATWDWSFPYVTCHFVLLPPACLFFLLGGVIQLVRPRERRYIALFPILAAVAMLLMLVFDPINSLRAGIWL